MTEDQKSNLLAFQIPSFVPVYKLYEDTLPKDSGVPFPPLILPYNSGILLWYNKKEILHLSQIGY